MAHSLGTVVTYDILYTQVMLGVGKELNFDIENYFLLGSPLGLF